MKRPDPIKPLTRVILRPAHIPALALAVLGLGHWLPSARAAPVNDNFANAIVLAGASGSLSGHSTLDATLEAGEPAHTSGTTNTVWFKWVCTQAGSFTVNTLGSKGTGTGEWDAVLGIYTGSAVNALTPLGDSPMDSSLPGGYEETMTVSASVGTTYYIQLGGYGNAEATDIVLTWSLAGPSAACDITAFGPGAVIDGLNITWTMPYGTTASQVAALAPSFTLSTGATCSQPEGAIPNPALNTTGTVIYKVTAQDGTHYKDYAVSVIVTSPSAACDITQFGIPGNPAVIDGLNIYLTVSASADLATLAPDYSTSEFATGEPATGVAPVPNFDMASNHEATYTITAQDGTTHKHYLVKVTRSALPVTSGLACWFDAAQGLTSDGSGVLSWDDQSGNGHTATRSAGTLSQATAQVNDRPAIRFRSSAYANLSGSLFAKAQYIVLRLPNSGGEWGSVLGSQTGSGYLLNRNGSFWDGRPAEAVTQNGTAVGNAPYYNLSNIGSFMLLKIIGNSNDPSVRAGWALGRQEGWYAPDMDVAEIIAYNAKLAAADDAAVGAYLANKYALVTPYTPPVAPSGLAARPLHHGIRLDWTASRFATDYNVYRGTLSGIYDPVPIGTTGGLTTYKDTPGTLVDGTPYYYVVRGVNDAGVGPASDEASAAASAVKVSQAITFNALADKTYGNADFDLTATASSELPVSYTSSVPLVASVTGTTVTLHKAGTTTITASQTGDTDFLAAEPVTQTLTVNMANQAIVFTLGLTVVKQSNALPFDDVASGGASGNPVTYASTNTAVATVDPVTGRVTIKGLGTTEILADQPGAADHYNAAPQVSQQLKVISPLPLPVAEGVVCWYEASSITVADGAVVNTWNDQSGNEHTATRLSGSPTFAQNDVKYNIGSNSRAGVHFRGTNGIFNCAGAMFVKEQYVVVRSPNANWVGSLSFLGRKSNDFLSVRESSYNIANGTTGFWQDHYPVTVVKNGYAPAPYPAVVNNNTNRDKKNQFANGCKFAIDDITDYMILKIVVDADASAADLVAYPYYQIGQNETIGSGEFDVAEIIGYNTTLSAADEAAMGFYLENKYGLPAPNYADMTPQAVFVNFSINGLPTRIDQARREIVVTAVAPVDLSVLMPTFTLSNGATCKVDGATVTSAVTPVNHTPAHYIITSSDASKTADYTVTVNLCAPTHVAVAVTPLDVSASGTGAEIQNTDTFVEANHFGSSPAVLTLDNGLVFGTSTAHLTQSPGGASTNSDSQALVPSLTDATHFGKLMRSYIWGSNQTATLTIPGLTPGHTYRLQWITSNPRGGNIALEGNPSVPLTGNSDAPTVLGFTWVANDATANVLITRQNNPSYGGIHDSEILLNGYALHDMGVIMPPAVISNVTASQTIPSGTTTVTLGGKVSNGGTIYPADGDVALVTINGRTYHAAIAGGAGAFSITLPTAWLPANDTPYPITYRYVGNGTTLFAAPNHTGTALAVISGDPYAAWTASKQLSGSDAGVTADPDGDGVPNGMEFVLGGEPNPARAGSNSRSLLPSATRNPDGVMVFTFHRKDLSESSALLTFQWSTDLSFPVANNIAVAAVSSSTNGVTVDVTENSPDADTDLIVVSVPANKAAGGMLFGRLGVTIQSGVPTTSAYDTWIATKLLTGADATTAADPDLDGTPNLLEFVLGGEPNPARAGFNSRGLMPTVAQSGANLVFTYRRSAVALTQPGITISAEYGSDLSTWTPAQHNEGGVSIVVTPDGFGAGIDKVEVSIPQSLASGTKLFVHLKVTVP